MYQVYLTESYFPLQPGKELIRESIGETLRLAASDSANKTALVAYRSDGTVNREYTYAQLFELAEGLALRLSAKYEKGTRIAICAHNIPEWVVLEYAAALAGIVVVTINPSFQVSEVSYVIQQSRAVALYHVSSCRGNPIAEIAREVQSEVPTLRTLVNVEDTDSFLGAGDPEAPCLPDVSSNDTVQIQYTSGTTGFPKGAVLHHRGLLNNSLLIGERMGMDENLRYLNMMPMFHTGGCGVGTLTSLVFRGTVVLLEQFVPSVVNELIEREQITCFLAAPTMLVGILEDLKHQPRRHSTVNAVGAGGAMVAPKLVQESMSQWGCPVQVNYGQTEASPVVTLTWKDDSLADLTETVGQPLPHTEVSIRDPSNNTVVPLNQVGEICARGYSIMHEYNDNPEATAATLDSEGWLHTGDLGTMDSRGFVRVTGRIKEMIIRGGENLFPAEIENTMISHPAIAEVAVVGIPSEKWGEEVGCFIRWEESANPISAEKLVDYALETLSPQKKPRYWWSVEAWPLTASGKIQKFKLLEQCKEGLHKPI